MDLAREPRIRSHLHAHTMSDALSIVYLARHGETAWSISGQHTGLADRPLTKRGERNAICLWDDTNQVGD